MVDYLCDVRKGGHQLLVFCQVYCPLLDTQLVRHTPHSIHELTLKPLLLSDNEGHSNAMLLEDLGIFRCHRGPKIQVMNNDLSFTATLRVSQLQSRTALKVLRKSMAVLNAVGHLFVRWT